MIKGVTSFHVTLPISHNHKLCSPLLQNKIFELVEDEITNVKVIKKLPRKYVKDLFKQDIIKLQLCHCAYYKLYTCSISIWEIFNG